MTGTAQMDEVPACGGRRRLLLVGLVGAMLLASLLGAHEPPRSHAAAIPTTAPLPVAAVGAGTLGGYAKGFTPPEMDLSYLGAWTPPAQASITETLPAAFDWRDVDGVNYVTPVNDPGTWGCCYAFAALGNVVSK